MLQIIFTILIFSFSTDVMAQSIPAYLRQEAAQGQGGLQQQPQDVNSLPAFLRNNEQERLELQQQQQFQQQMIQPQDQYNYQSADPDSGVFTLPPAVYQPTPGAVPAFIREEQSGSKPKSDDVDLRTNKKEDVIQINFTEDQYKAEQQGEVTTLDKEQATKYNTEIQKNTEDAGESTEEIPEGARFEGQTEIDPTKAAAADKNDTEKKAEQERQAISETTPEPAKAATNLMRLSYSKEETELSEKDKTNLLTIVRLLKSNKQQKISLKAYTSARDLGADPRKMGLTRIIGIREFLMKQGVNFSQTEVKVIEPELNKEDLDYIDIDKI